MTLDELLIHVNQQGLKGIEYESFKDSKKNKIIYCYLLVMESNNRSLI